VTSITKRLFHTLPTAAPSVNFIVDFRILDCDGSHNWAQRFRRLLWSCNTGFFLFILFVFKVSKVFNVEFRKVGLIKRY